MDLMPPTIVEQREKIARLTLQIEALRRELAEERYIFRRRLIGHIFAVLAIETEVDMQLRFPEKPTDNTDACAICLEPLCEKPVREIKCHHLFHKHCIDRWVQNHDTCPLCRESIDLSGSTSTIMLQLLRMLAQEL